MSRTAARIAALLLWYIPALTSSSSPSSIASGSLTVTNLKAQGSAVNWYSGRGDMTLSHAVDIIRKDFIELDSSQGQVMPLGGAKKKSLAQMGKTQDQQDKKPEAPKKSKGKPPAEKKLRGVDLPNLEDTRFLSELSKMGAITPYALASQFNLRISVAKDMLEELERKRLVTAVGGNARIRIYKMAAA